MQSTVVVVIKDKGFLMCILFIARHKHPQYPLIIAANRDEFYARPTLPADYWPDAPFLLGGKDLEANGTWMGVTREGRIAAITNVRSPNAVRSNAVSRGELVTHWLKSNTLENTPLTSDQYLDALKHSRNNYSGYNLVFGDAQSLCVYNNVNNSEHSIDRGVFGLSNADIITPWPKVTQGVSALNHYVAQHNTINTEDLFSLLRQENKAEDEKLPDTGIGYEWEKALSSIFINIKEYGTRTSTIVLVDTNGELTFKERSFSEDGEITQTREFLFTI